MTTTTATAFGAITTWAAITSLVGGWAFVGIFATGQELALVYQNLDTNNSVGRMCFGGTVINVRTQGMQRHAAFAIPFGTCNFDTIETSNAHDFDALGTQAHCILHCVFHGTTEHNTTLELLSNRVSNQLCIGFRLADFFDVYMNRYAHE